jgi:deoxyribonuclease V
MKSPFTKEHFENRFAISRLFFKNKTVGMVLRSRENIKPLFVSPGHLIDLESSVEVVKLALSRYRLPEMIRKAHTVVNQERKEAL